MKTTSEEIRLFNHDECGEGFLAMAYHVKSISQLELKQIRNANGHLPAVGALLYKIQQGKVKMNNPPSDPEWSILWDAYHERQQAISQNP